MEGAAKADVALLAPFWAPTVADNPVVAMLGVRAIAHQLNHMIDDRVVLVAPIVDALLVMVPPRGINDYRDGAHLHKGLQKRLLLVCGQAENSRDSSRDFGGSGTEVACLAAAGIGGIRVGRLVGDATTRLDMLEGHPRGSPTAAHPRAIVAAAPGVVGAVQDLLHREFIEGARLDRPNALHSLNRRERPAAPAAALVLRWGDHTPKPPVPFLGEHKVLGKTSIHTDSAKHHCGFAIRSQKDGTLGHCAQRVGELATTHEGAVILLQLCKLRGEAIGELVDALLPACMRVLVVATNLIKPGGQQLQAS
eukprot:RCo028024